MVSVHQRLVEADAGGDDLHERGYQEEDGRGVIDPGRPLVRLDEDEVEVSLEIDTSEISAIKITGVYIALSGKAAWSNVNDVSKYMENLVGVKVNVTRK